MACVLLEGSRCVSKLLIIQCVLLCLFPELEEALDLKLNNTLTVENESNKRKVSLTLLIIKKVFFNESGHDFAVTGFHFDFISLQLLREAAD